MSEYPYLPLFVTDYRAATDHLSDAEHGIYLQILMLMWQSPDCRIPDDDEWLARRFRRDANAVRTHMRPLILEFCFVHEGWITQKRLQREWRWRREKSTKSSNAAKSMWRNKKEQSERNASVQSERYAPTLPYPTLPQEKERKKEEREPRAKRARARTPLSDDWQCSDADKNHASSLGFTPPQIATMASSFSNHHRAKGSLMADWPAAWRTWCGNEIKFNRPTNGGGNYARQLTPSQRAAQLADEARRLEVIAGLGRKDAAFGRD